MEILFMVFMVIVSIMALFAVLVVLRDIVKEIFGAREKAEPRTDMVREAEAIVAKAAAEEPPVTVLTVVEQAPEAPAVEEAPAEEAATEPVAEPEPEDDGKISFSAGQQQTLEEKYLALSSEARGWYDEIIKHASMVEGSKRYKNLRYEEYKVGKNRLVRMLIKRGVINCEFILHNSDFKNYVSENKISVKQSATTMLIENEATVEAAKNSIDIVVAFIAEEREYKKQQARERRKAQKAAAEAESAE